MMVTMSQLITIITKYVRNADKGYFHSSMDYVCAESKWDSENFLSTMIPVDISKEISVFKYVGKEVKSELMKITDYDVSIESHYEILK